MNRPNIILFCTDQQRSDSLGCSGNNIISTPNLDAIATSGTRFTRHITPNQICQPSRATMLTGLYPRHHHVLCNGMELNPTLPTLPGCLAAAGYQTHGVGKFHLQPIMAPVERGMPESDAFWETPAAENWQGPYYGFDTVDFLIGEADWSCRGGHYARWLKKEHPDAVALLQPEACLDATPADLPDSWKCAIPASLHYNTWIANRAQTFILQATEPFFLYVSFPDPHHPFSPPRPYCDRYHPSDMLMSKCEPGELDRMPSYIREIGNVIDQRLAAEQGSQLLTENISESSLRRAIAHTYGMIEMIDDCVGEVMATLRDRKLLDNTIVMFTSDHGEFLGDHGLLRKGPPPYRQLLEVSMLLSGPGIAAASTVNAPTSHLDIMPTLLDLAGVETPHNDGASWLPLLNGEKNTLRDTVYAEYHPRDLKTTYNHTLITDDWRFTAYPQHTEWCELFDLRNDPGEHRNLAHDVVCRSTRAELHALLNANFEAQPDIEAEQIARW